MKGYHTYKDCIEACLRCAAICNHCASSCTQEEDVKMMARCIQLDMECAAICYAAAQLMSMGSDKAKEICRICADVCEQCGAECGKHQTEHASNVRKCVTTVQKNADAWQVWQLNKNAGNACIFFQSLIFMPAFIVRPSSGA